MKIKRKAVCVRERVRARARASFLCTWSAVIFLIRGLIVFFSVKMPLLGRGVVCVQKFLLLPWKTKEISSKETSESLKTENVVLALKNLKLHFSCQNTC